MCITSPRSRSMPWPMAGIDGYSHVLAYGRELPSQDGDY
jgi:hypothetical protein